jgi:hypothetical protein
MSGRLTILRMTTTAVAGACLLGAAGLVELQADGHGRRAAAAEQVPHVATHTGPQAESLASQVADVQPLAAEAGTARCLAAGTACRPDDLLDVDTTRLRAGEVADVLHGARGSAAPALVGSTRTHAARLASALGAWLDDGCGGSVDGVALSGPVPSSCATEGTAAQGALHDWVTTIRRWTAQGGS